MKNKVKRVMKKINQTKIKQKLQIAPKTLK